MHPEVFSKSQVEILPLVKQYKREFYLAGGTAIALHIGHRKSIDFDFFKFTQINHQNIIKKIDSCGCEYKITRRVSEQLNVIINKVKFTFYQYPFEISATEKYKDILRMPNLLELAAMKAYDMGRRSKWKDYVDIYFFLKEHYSIKQISEKAGELFGQLFSEKLFRAQICYFEDIDYSEPVEFLTKPVHEDEVKNLLIERSTDI